MHILRHPKKKILSCNHAKKNYVFQELISKLIKNSIISSISGNLKKKENPKKEGVGGGRGVYILDSTFYLITLMYEECDRVYTSMNEFCDTQKAK